MIVIRLINTSCTWMQIICMDGFKWIEPENVDLKKYNKDS